MKDSKFIELLNLYVDHQISPADVALLEAEVQRTPERRRVYREYCMMQKACSELGETFRGEATAPQPKLVQFPARRNANSMPYFAAFGAVAACAAVVFAMRSNSPALPVVPASSPAPIVAVTPKVTPVRAERPALQPVFGPRLLAATSEPAAGQSELGDWMNSVQLSTLPGNSEDDLRFDTHASLQPVNRSNRTARPFQGKVEWTVFSFQK